MRLLDFLPAGQQPTPTDQTGMPTPLIMGDVARAQRKIQITASGRDSTIPIIYGGWERTGGLLYLVRLYQQKLLMVILLCEGPVEEVGTVEMNDAAVPASVTVTKYTGSQTTVNATLAAAIPGFAETFAGTAYMVCQVPAGASQGFPRFTAEIKGRKVYDPRTATTVWSDNPALCLADFLSNSTFGAGKTIDWTSVTTAANFCDEMIGSPAEKRCLLTFTISGKRPVSEWVDVLRSYVPCWVLDDGDTVSLVVDEARATDHTFAAASIDTSPEPRLKKRGVMDVPTVVEIGYTNTTVTPWATGYAEAATGSAIRRKARIDMPGIRRYSQARRFAIERLNHYTLEDLEIEFSVFEDGLKVREGDVVEVTDSIGLSGKKFRVLECSDKGNGRWGIKAREYNAGAYSTVVESTGDDPDLSLPNPRVVAAPTALSITETVYLEKTQANDSLARNFIYQSRFDVTWTAADYAYPATYRVEVYNGAALIHEGATPLTRYATPAVQQGNTYTVKVYTRSGLGYESEALIGSQVAQGKLLAPGNVPSITRAFEIGGEVLLEWQPAVDIDVIRYEWRYGATSGFSWDSATLVDRIDGLRARFKGLPVGTWRFAVKAIDSVGNYSATPTTVDVTITSDADSILQDREFTSPTLTNMQGLVELEGTWAKRWATRVSSDAWNSAMPNPLTSGSNPVSSYHASATSKFVGEAWDVGIEITGDWTLNTDDTALSGTISYSIETSPDGTTYTARSGKAYTGTARFVRPVLEATTTSTIALNRPPTIGITTLTRKEAGGPVTSSASTYSRVTLAGQYFKATRITVTPRGTAARIATVDNVVMSTSGTNSFDVYIFDAAGTQVASDYDWSFEGF